jgi:hypothetical protein
MTSADEYRKKAAELRAKARYENAPTLRAEFEALALSYVRLAEQADRNQRLDVSYESPPPKEGEPDLKC